MASPDPRRLSQQDAKSEERRRLQSDLHAQLVAAEAKLEAAKGEYDRLAAVWFGTVDDSSDGSSALRQAMAVRQDAVRNYTKILLEWVEFQLDAGSSTAPAHG